MISPSVCLFSLTLPSCVQSKLCLSSLPCAVPPEARAGGGCDSLPSLAADAALARVLRTVCGLQGSGPVHGEGSWEAGRIPCPHPDPSQAPAAPCSSAPQAVAALHPSLAALVDSAPVKPRALSLLENLPCMGKASSFLCRRVRMLKPFQKQRPCQLPGTSGRATRCSTAQALTAAFLLCSKTATEKLVQNPVASAQARLTGASLSARAGSGHACQPDCSLAVQRELGESLRVPFLPSHRLRSVPGTGMLKGPAGRWKGAEHRAGPPWQGWSCPPALLSCVSGLPLSRSWCVLGQEKSQAAELALLRD